MLDIVFKSFSFLFVTGLVLVGELWLMAQIEPPGGRTWRAVLLMAMIAVAMYFGWAATQPTMLPADG